MTVVNGIGRNDNILILKTRIHQAYGSVNDSNFRFSLVISAPTTTLTLSLVKTSFKKVKAIACYPHSDGRP